VEQLKDRITPCLFISELRTIAADSLWLSPAYQCDSLALHFTWKPDMAAVLAVLPLIEEALASFGARPHWAKVFTTPGDRIAELYPKLPDFHHLASLYDPESKFRNSYLQRVIPI
jgi:alditol oxidase